MKTQLLYFAALKEALGKSGESLDYSSPLTGQGLLELLSLRYPQAAETIQACTLAQNMEYTPLGEEIRPNAEVALIPPVSGG